MIVHVFVFYLECLYEIDICYNKDIVLSIGLTGFVLYYNYLRYLIYRKIKMLSSK